MSYLPKPVGHDDTPLEQRIEVEQDREIELFAEFISEHDYLDTIHFSDFFNQYMAWSAEKVMRALITPSVLDAFREYDDRYAGAKSAEWYGELLSRLLAHAVKDPVIIYNGWPAVSNLFGPETERVLVVNQPPLNATIGQWDISGCLIILNTNCPCLTVHANASTIVNLGIIDHLKVTTSFGEISNVQYVHATTSPRPFYNPSGFVLECRDGTSCQRDYLYPGWNYATQGRKTSPALRTYLSTLIAHCHEPARIPEVYGKQFFSTIWNALQTHHENALYLDADGAQ